MHKTANILDKLPKGAQPKAKGMIHQICMAETRNDANKAFDAFLETYEAKYPKAPECLRKDRDELLAFYDFPPEHWRHLRTTNPIESTFATIRLRHRRTKGNGSRVACHAMMFKLAQSAEKRWRLLNGSEPLPEVLQGIVFQDGVRLPPSRRLIQPHQQDFTISRRDQRGSVKTASVANLRFSLDNAIDW